jgi:predicted DNA-binding protein (UPF0251 family)
MMGKIAMVLTEQEQAELQVILTDQDAAAALKFLKEVVWAQVQAARRKALKGPLDADRG